VKTHLIALLFASATFAATDPAQLAAAKALYNDHKFPDAESAFKKLVAADATNSELHYYLGMSVGQRGDPEAASKNLEKAVELAPTNAQYHFDFGNFSAAAAEKAGMLSKYGLAKKCLAAFKRAAELEPANVNFHQALFEFYRQAPGIAGGGADKAEVEAAAILKLDPIRGHVAYVTLHSANQDYAKALPHLAEIKQLDPVRGRMAFAAYYTEKKEYDKAFAEFDEVLKTAPDDYSALYQVGKLSALTGQQLDRGVASLRRCLALEMPGVPGTPTRAAAQWRIGNILEKKSDLIGARAAYEASLKLDPKFTNAADALKKLK
jgi:tetratricopeptide (TPR) repeat protein